MDEMTNKEAALAWGWVLEALADIREIGVSLLHDLIEMAPDLPEDLEKKVNERVALRCLEDLFAPPNISPASVSTRHSKASFDFSARCDDVLQRIVTETPESELREGGVGLLKWDVQPFITHKRSSLPKCALAQIKDSILDGTHPYADFLIRKSGLRPSTTPDGGGDYRVGLSGSRSRLKGSFFNPRNVRVEGNDANVLPSKRVRIASDSDNIADDNHLGVNDSRRNAKKMRGNGSSVLGSVEHNPISLPRNKLLGSLSERDIPVIESGRRVLAEHDIGMLEENEALEDGHDSYTTTSKRRGQSGEETIRKSQLESEHCHGPTASRVVPPDKTEYRVSAKGSDCNSESQKKTIADGAEDPINCRGESSNIDGLNNETIDVGRKKRDFLDSQCTINRAYSDTIDWTEKNLCMKCNEGGQLLVCDTIDCPLVYHEDCLGSEFVSYERGKFYCPFCLHSLTLKEYLEAKKRTSLLGKDLGAFMSAALEKRPAKFLGRNFDEDLFQ